MSNFTTSMFDSIKSSLTKEDSGGYKDIIKLEVGNTYTGRLLPNLKDPTKTFLHYYTYDWNSFSTGKYCSIVSPSTWDLRDPIAEERFRIHKHGTAEEKEKSATVRRVERWLVNYRVGNDPVTADNNGKTKIVRFGKQLHKIIMEAIEGEEADEYGARIFDLSENGCNFKIKVEQQGEFASYVGSKFTTPRTVEGLDSTDIDNVYASILDLNKYVAVKSYEEVKDFWKKHYVNSEPVEDEKSAPVVEKKDAPIEVKPAIAESVNDEAIEDLLKDL